MRLTLLSLLGLLVALAGCGPAASVQSGLTSSASASAASTGGAGTSGHATSTSAASTAAGSTSATAAGSTSSTSSSSSSSASSSSSSTSASSAAASTTTGAGSTGGSTGATTGASTGTTGADCCGGACQGSGQFCDTASCTCATFSATCNTGALGSNGVPADAIDLSTVTILNSPDVSAWPATAAITLLDLQPTGAHVEFTKQDGADRWPDVADPSRWANGDTIQYTLWMVVNVAGQWYASGGIEFWYGRHDTGDAPSTFAADWYYDPGRWGPMATHQPAPGEVVGFLVTAGDARNNGLATVQERSNVILVPFPLYPPDTAATYACASGPTTGGTTGGGSTGGTTGGSTGGTSGGGTDCCGGGCQASGQQCASTTCQCVTVPVDDVDLSSATILNSPNVATWPATARITQLDIRSNGAHVEFTKQDGAERWPDVTPPGWTGPLQYTLWMVENVGGQWYASGGIEFWYGRDSTGDAPSSYAADWYYDPGRWGPMATHQPAPGEMVGFLVTAGDARNNGVTLVEERSNVVLVPFPDDTGATFTY